MTDKMTIEQAIEYLETKLEWDCCLCNCEFETPDGGGIVCKEIADCAVGDAVNMAIEALEKQIPKKPIEFEDDEHLYCDRCGHPTLTGRKESYCWICGQHIDWESDTDGI